MGKSQNTRIKKSQEIREEATQNDNSDNKQINKKKWKMCKTI